MNGGEKLTSKSGKCLEVPETITVANSDDEDTQIEEKQTSNFDTTYKTDVNDNAIPAMDFTKDDSMRFRSLTNSQFNVRNEQLKTQILTIYKSLETRNPCRNMVMM